jgi:tripartite ATP-independent transporter DctP family solute receptor
VTVALRLAVSALLLFALTSVTHAEDKIVLKLGHALSPDSHYQLSALVFAKAVTQKTQGKIEVQVFAQSQLGGEVQMTQALRTGTQDLMISGQSAVENTIKQWEVFDIPFLFGSVEQANSVLQGPAGKKFLDMMPSANMIGLTWLSAIERNVFTVKKPVKSLGDMKDLKLRVLQSPGYIAGYKALGANPTPLAYSQLFLALSQGLVDGADTSPDQFVQDKFIDIAKYYQLTRINYIPVVLAISKNTWNKLTPESQKAVQEAAKEAAQFDQKEYRRQYDESLALLKTRGIEVREIDTKPWVAAAEAARGEFIATIPDGKTLYAEILAAKQSGSSKK